MCIRDRPRSADPPAANIKFSTVSFVKKNNIFIIIVTIVKNQSKKERAGEFQMHSPPGKDFSHLTIIHNKITKFGTKYGKNYKQINYIISDIKRM